MKLRIFVPLKIKIKLSHFGLRRGLCGTFVKLTLFEESVQNRLYLNVCAKTTIVCKGNLGRERSRPWIQIKAICGAPFSFSSKWSFLFDFLGRFLQKISKKMIDSTFLYFHKVKLPCILNILSYLILLQHKNAFHLTLQVVKRAPKQ